MINERFKNLIKQAKSDINSDHIHVKIMMNLKLKKLREVKVKEQLELELVKQPDIGTDIILKFVTDMMY